MTAVDTPNNRPENTNDTPDTANVDPKIIALKDNEIADLKVQLEKAEQRESVLIAEKSRLLDLTDRLTLMIPAPKEKAEKSVGWLQRLFGISTS